MKSKELGIVLYTLSAILLLVSISMQVYESDVYQNKAVISLKLILVIVVSCLVHMLAYSKKVETIWNIIFTVICVTIIILMLLSDQISREFEVNILYSLLTGYFLAGSLIQSILYLKDKSH